MVASAPSPLSKQKSATNDLAKRRSVSSVMTSASTSSKLVMVSVIAVTARTNDHPCAKITPATRRKPNVR